VNTDRFDIDLADAAQSGVFFVGDADLRTLEGSARDHGLAVSRVDLSGCTDKTGLMRRLADTLAFPASFGHNWDALADSLGDLSWLPAPGHVLLVDHAGDLRDADEAAFDTLLDILDHASSTWAAHHTPFFTFLVL
jgi:RNAse (barnase) inhibitor barstar